MSIFGQIGKRISQTGQDASQKVRDIRGTIKLNNQIAEEKRSIDEMLMRIGETYYELHNEDPEEAFAEFIDSINASEVKIDECRRQINYIKSLAECPVCGRLNDKDAAYCPKCGAKMPQMIVEPGPEDAGERVCEICGTKVEKGILFCPVCGSLVDDGEELPETEASDETDADETDFAEADFAEADFAEEEDSEAGAAEAKEKITEDEIFLRH